MLAIWHRIEVDDLPASFYWQRGVFELMRENFTEVRWQRGGQVDWQHSERHGGAVPSHPCPSQSLSNPYPPPRHSRLHPLPHPFPIPIQPHPTPTPSLQHPAQFKPNPNPKP